MKILAIETSADETAAAITSERRVLSNVIYSQILLHKKWGGIYPSLAKRAHEEKIDNVIAEAIKKFEIRNSKSETNSNYQNSKLKNIDYIAVTQGPGLAVALEVGIKKAKELAQKYNKKLIAVNHLEGHIYSSFVQNSKGNPKRDFRFPYLALIVSGGHTEIALFKNHIDYLVLGETRDDAAGEALDKAAKMLGLGYPGGPAIERLAAEVDNKDFYHFPRPMIASKSLDFSFSGLKTSLFYFLNSHVIARSKATKQSQKEIATPRLLGARDDKNIVLDIRQLASSFQEAVFETLMVKTELAIKKTGINRLVVGGGVIANLHLRKLLRNLLIKHNGEVYLPPFKYLSGDNAVMIGVAAYYKAKKDLYVKNLNLDRIPRLSLSRE